MGIAPGLAVGNPADFVTLNAGHPVLYGRTGDHVLDSWVFAARNTCIDTVWKRGQKLVSGWKHRGCESVIRRYLKIFDRIVAK
jgi:cytosine/adenosine deaminase-related metal-dependent hydrolase